MNVVGPGDAGETNLTPILYRWMRLFRINTRQEGAEEGEGGLSPAVVQNRLKCKALIVELLSWVTHTIECKYSEYEKLG